jgi:hypothetical protein
MMRPAEKSDMNMLVVASGQKCLPNRWELLDGKSEIRPDRGYDVYLTELLVSLSASA